MIPFDFDCDFVKNHFGKDKQRQINYQEFTQIIHVINIGIRTLSHFQY